MLAPATVTVTFVVNVRGDPRIRHQEFVGIDVDGPRNGGVAVAIIIPLWFLFLLFLFYLAKTLADEILLPESMVVDPVDVAVDFVLVLSDKGCILVPLGFQNQSVDVVRVPFEVGGVDQGNLLFHRIRQFRVIPFGVGRLVEKGWRVVLVAPEGKIQVEIIVI
jgi:hypothetical protein